MLIKVCIEVGVVDKVFHDSYFVLWIWKEVVLFMEQIVNSYDNCDQTYFGVGIFHEKVELAIYNME